MTPALLLPLVALLALQSSPVTVERLATPEKALRFEVTVPAPLDDVWAAFTTQAGLQTWLWKDERVDQLLTQLRQRFISSPVDWSTFK